MALGEVDTAEALFNEGIANERLFADPANRVCGLVQRAMATLEHGTRQQAHARLVEALEENLRVGQAEGAALCLEGLTLLALKLSDRAMAARLCGAAGAVWSAGGMPRFWYQKLFEQRMRAVRCELAELEPESWREGMAMSLATATGTARSLATLMVSSPQGSATVADSQPPQPDGPSASGVDRIGQAADGRGPHAPETETRRATLTSREAEIAGLIATGCSNREIAAALVLSVRTVERHLDNIYAKTGLHGRQQLRAYARSHALAPPAASAAASEP